MKLAERGGARHEHEAGRVAEGAQSGKRQFRPPSGRRPACGRSEARASALTYAAALTRGGKAACQCLPGGHSLAAMDKLEEIFQMQDALNRRIGVNLPPPTDEEKAKWILNYTRAMQQETAELIDSVPWKWWAKYQKFDEQNAKVEVVDLFHFLVSLAQTLGMTADDVYQAYLKKNAVNHQRQDSGYAKKDEADSKHI
jgi:dimeric dUTPase (all-alpha-NTP-PPase superfamily)